MSIEVRRSTAGRAVVVLTILAFQALAAEPVRAGGMPAQCARNATAEANLEAVRAAENDKTRVVAASSLIKDWAMSLPTVMRELSKISGSSERWQPDQSSYFLSITDILRTVLSTNVEAIKLFRSCDEPSMVKPLIWAARGQNQGMRLNATLILGNVIDNTTVCFVLHHLRDPSINQNGRANLLGVTLAVAGYAYLENIREIKKTLDLIKPGVEADAARTQKLIADIYARASASSNASTSLLQADLEKPCAEYDYDNRLE
jgi:hypothetical protein